MWPVMCHRPCCECGKRRRRKKSTSVASSRPSARRTASERRRRSSPTNESEPRGHTTAMGGTECPRPFLQSLSLPVVPWAESGRRRTAGEMFRVRIGLESRVQRTWAEGERTRGRRPRTYRKEGPPEDLGNFYRNSQFPLGPPQVN